MLAETVTVTMTSSLNSTDSVEPTTVMNLNSTMLPSVPTAPFAAAISAATPLPPNPSTTASASAAITSTAKPDHHAEHDELDHSILAGFSDIQTVFLACISTLLPLIVALGIAFGVRHIWRKYRNRRDSSSGLPWYKGVCSRDNTTDSLHHRPHMGSNTIQPATRILSAQDLVNGLDGPRYICETEVMEEVNATTTAPVEYTSPGKRMTKNANGNIITLTLKNNDLIVETEERVVPMEDDKNRRYPDNSCSFVVEVQPSYQNGNEAETNKGSSDDLTGGVTDQQALVHREELPEDRSSGIENARMFGLNTGLSQSDLSISSQGSVNPSYRYGNQVEYDTGHLGYPMYGGSYESDTLSRKLEGSSKWVEFDKSPDTDKALLNVSKTSSIEKDVGESPSIVANRNNLDASQCSATSSIDQQDSTDASNSTDTVRSNPNLQVNGATPNKLKIMEQKALSNELNKGESNKPVITGALLKDEVQEDTFQEQQRKLGNGTLTPEHKDDKSKDQKPQASAFVPSHKRTGSIPPRLIEETLENDRKQSMDIYTQIKSSTKSILPSLSPKFELLQNEVSPIEEKES